MKCISAELAKLKIQRVCFCRCLDEETENDLINAIDETQAEDVKRNVYGEWEYHSNPDCGIDPEDAFCTICGFYIDRTLVDNFDNYNFCPRCGAQMKERKETKELFNQCHEDEWRQKAMEDYEESEEDDGVD